jgi:hypothetical protein
MTSLDENAGVSVDLKMNQEKWRWRWQIREISPQRLPLLILLLKRKITGESVRKLAHAHEVSAKIVHAALIRTCSSQRSQPGQ